MKTKNSKNVCVFMYKVTRYDVYRYNQYSGIDTAVYYSTEYDYAVYTDRHRFVRV